MQMAPKQDAKTRMRVIRRLLGYMFKHWYFVIPALLMTLFSNQLALLGPEYLGEAIDAIAAENGPLMDTVYYNFYERNYGSSQSEDHIHYAPPAFR